MSKERVVEKGGDLRPQRRSVTSQMLLGKFQRQQEQARERLEWVRCNESHWIPVLHILLGGRDYAPIN
jgi:hypothetical protein